MTSATGAAESAAASALANPQAAFALVAASAQAILSGLPPGPATTLMVDSLQGATVGASWGAAIGGAIFGDAGAAAAGGFGAEVGAEIGFIAGVVPQLEADHWNILQSSATRRSGVGAGAAAGAAAGSFIPVIGTGVGALVGSVVGDLAGATNPPLQDCRYLSEKLSSPAVAPVANNADTNADGVFGLIPGQIDSTFRALPNSTFYQTQGGLNSAWANEWAMLVTWRSPSR